MKKNNKKVKMSYEPEADVLRVEISKKSIDFAVEIGNVIVHFSPDNIPVYFEILDATGFLRRASTMLDPAHKRILMPVFR